MDTPTPDANLLGTSATFADPYPLYQQLRASSPVRYQWVRPGKGVQSYYALLKYADVSAALRDPETFSSRKVHSPSVPDDFPRQAQLRRQMSKAFTPKRVADLTPSIAEMVRELADGLGPGPVDLMEAYAVPLPLRVLARVIGIPEGDYPTFRRWTAAILSHEVLPLGELMGRRAGLEAYMRAQVAAPRPSGAEDLIAALLETEVGGERLTENDIVGLVYLILVAGHETTVHLIGNMLGLLADRPDLWRRAREDRSLVAPILSEVLRLESPVQRMDRLTTRPVELSGVPIPEGHLVVVYFGAANRDPAVFEDPDTFRLDRPPVDHLAFGQGFHFCIGMHLARVQASLTLNHLLDRFPTLERGAERAVRQARTPLSYGYQRLPLVLA